MSAFMVSDLHIDAILTAGLDMAKYGPLRWLAPAEVTTEGTHQRGEPWGPAAVEEYNRRKRELTRETAGRVGAMLLAENAASVNHRYDEEEAEQPYNYTRYARPLSAVQILKAIDCFEYQACEHPEWHESEAYAFCQSLRSAMIHLLPGYDQADWEILPESAYSQTCPKCQGKVNTDGVDANGKDHRNQCHAEEPAPYVQPREAITRIRRVLKARCKTLSVRMGKGTAFGWIEISGSGDFGNFSPEERAALEHFGLNSGSNFAVISPDELGYWVKKLQA